VPTGGSHVRRLVICSALVSIVVRVRSGAEKAGGQDMTLVGYDDLQARSAYHPTIHAQNGRWIAYIGHHGGSDADPKPSIRSTASTSSTAPR